MSLAVFPSVLANDVDDFAKRLRRLLPITDDLHIDIMDGKFVPSQSIGVNDFPDVKRWPKKRFEAHLMVSTPGAYIQPLARRGFKRIIFHLEAAGSKGIPLLIAQCRKYQLEVGIALNPETPVERVLPYVDAIESVILMGGHPGFNGAPYMADTPKRIRALAQKSTNKRLEIQVDIGMRPETIGDAVRAGANRFDSGSYVSNASDPKKALDLLRRAAAQAQAQAIPAVPRKEVNNHPKHRPKSATKAKKDSTTARKKPTRSR